MVFKEVGLLLGIVNWFEGRRYCVICFAWDDVLAKFKVTYLSLRLVYCIYNLYFYNKSNFVWSADKPVRYLSEIIQFWSMYEPISFQQIGSMTLATIDVLPIKSFIYIRTNRMEIFSNVMKESRRRNHLDLSRLREVEIQFITRRIEGLVFSNMFLRIGHTLRYFIFTAC